MAYALAVLCIGLMVLSLFLLVLGLPGNWVIFGLTLAWSFISEAGFGWQFFAVFFGLAALGEAMEFAAGHFGGKRFGGTGKGSIGGIIGALLLGIFCAPLMFGLGALLGALGGGFLGSFLFEKLHGMETSRALKAAFGTMLGRFGGFLAKIGVGICLIALAAPRIWQSASGGPAKAPAEELIITLGAALQGLAG